MPNWSLVSYHLSHDPTPSDSTHDDSTRDDSPRDIRVGVLELDGTVLALDAFAGRTLLEVIDDWQGIADDLRGLDTASLPIVADAKLVAPLAYPRKIICAGANYYAHLAEMGVPRPDPVGAPYFFLKPPTTTVIGPTDAIRLPDRDGRRIDWEAELGVIIGRTARNIGPEHVADHIAGYVVLNDITSRDLLARTDAVAPPFGFDWTSAKGDDTFCPMGPGITPVWFVPDPQDVHIRLSVNGVVKQDSSTADMINPVFQVVSVASRLMTLEPGDVIATGCPAGVGAPRGDFLQPGDEVVVEIEGLGSLRNPVVDARNAHTSPAVSAALGRTA
jgi:2-keto-4-pentenoate hydratase/2-oxohepta-3-ene-1,7-dioic acid hydratase in catechol pathway